MENTQLLNKLREDHKKLVKSGMFWEFYPELSGIWEEDKEEWIASQKRLETWREKFNKKADENLSKKETVDFSEEYKTCQKILKKANLNDKMTGEMDWHKISTSQPTNLKPIDMFYNYYITTGTREPSLQIFTNTDGKRELQLVYPGKKKEDFNLSLSGNLLNIKVDEYVKEFTVPPDTDKNNISAKYEAGILRITLPTKKPKKIEVK